ncbi:hypothetical protein TrRE_jg10632, partial [Triparma retinervis]
MTYHSSPGIILNHRILLPIYLYGMILTATPSKPAFVAVLTGLAGFGAVSMRGLGVVFAAIVLAPLAAGAHYFNEWLMDFGGKPVCTYSTGGLVMLAALLLQVLGHKMFEKLEAADLRHGLFAAPVLEFAAGWVRGSYG